MTRTLNATYANQWHKISTTKTVTLTIKGWRKWVAILLRRPKTYDVEMTASTWVKGEATIDIGKTGVVYINPLTDETLVFNHQKEWK